MHRPGEDIRPLGIPIPFLPLDTRGELLLRRVVTAPVRDAYRGHYLKEYVVSVYPKSQTHGIETGAVVMLYEPLGSVESCLHVGRVELRSLVTRKGQPTLIDDMLAVRAELHRNAVPDDLQAFAMLTASGNISVKLQSLTNQLADLLLGDIGVEVDPQNVSLPYLLTCRTLRT